MKDNNQIYPRVGIGVLIFDHNKLLLGQRQQSHGNATWGPPGGHLEFGEQFEECACREVHEETGLIISNPTLFAITNDLFEKENKHYVSIFLKAPYPDEQTLINLEPHKTISWEWFTINQLPDELFLPLKNLIKRQNLDNLPKL